MGTALVETLLKARSGEVPVPELLRRLVGSDLVVPSGQPVAADGAGLQPLLYDRDGVPMVACFADRAGARSVATLAPHALRIRGGDLLRRIPAGHGLVVNPGLDAWFDLSPEGVARAIEAFVDPP